MNFEDAMQAFFSTLVSEAHEAGVELQRDAGDVAAYARERAEHLKTIVGDAGYSDAVKMERDNVALYAGLQTVAGATAQEERVIGVISGALSVLAVIA